MKLAALSLLLLGLLRHLVWPLLSPDVQALAWNACGALAITGLIGLVLWLGQSGTRWTRRQALPVLIVAGWWAFEELLVAGCSGWRMLQTVHVMPGQEQCSAVIGFPFGALSVCIVAAITAAISRKETT